MSEQSPPPGRGLFGYRRSAIDQMITDRDVMLRQAEGRVRAAEAKVSRLESELAGLQEQNAELHSELEAFRAGGLAPSVTGAEPGGELTTRFLNEELGTILTAAEESATRIIERARQATQNQVKEAERVWNEAQNQISRFAAWRDRVDPVLQSAQSKIDEVRSRIEDVPDQIRVALAPLADSIASLDGDLADVTNTANPPLLVAPTGTDAGPAPDVEDEGSSQALPDDEDEPGPEPSPDADVVVMAEEEVVLVDLDEPDESEEAGLADGAEDDSEHASGDR